MKNIDEYKTRMWVRITMKGDEFENRIFPVSTIDYVKGIVSINQNRTYERYYDIEYVQQVWPKCVKDGHVIGKGDKIEYVNKKYTYEVYDCIDWNGEFRAVTHDLSDKGTYFFKMNEDFTVIPLHAPEGKPKGMEAIGRIDRIDFLKVRKDAGDTVGPEYPATIRSYIAILEETVNQVIDTVNALSANKPKRE